MTFDLATHGLQAPVTNPRRIGPGTIDRLLTPLLDRAPDLLALVGRHSRYTISELDEVVDRAANALVALGVRKGDRVAASLPNQADIVVAFLGAMRVGAIWVGINRPLAAPEKAFMLRDAEVSVFLGDPEMIDQVGHARHELGSLRELVTVDAAAPTDRWRELIAEVSARRTDVPIDPLTPAAIAYTSGTTGFPKGAVHTHHNLLLPGAVSTARGTYARGAVLGVALPLTILNLIVLGPLVAYQAGLTLVAMDRIDPVGMAEWIRDQHITTFSAVPAMVHDLLTHSAVTDDMLASLSGIGVGGADMPEAFRRLYEARFGLPVVTGYGLTEAPTAVTVEDPTLPLVPDSCGRALPQCEIVIVGDDDAELPPGEVGEVCVRASSTGDFADLYRPMLGYWNRPEATAEALRGGMLHTGDIGVLDDEGDLFIKDRKHDLIIRGGANVYPAEVERVLHDDRRVAACAVVGAPDDRLGQRVVAYVQLAEPGSVTAEELRELCRTQLAGYKVPDAIEFVDAFDRTPMGKIRKTGLRKGPPAMPSPG
jgi:acyl-CoA synthetase (AMP-forming)/AMP-acid ligase II